MLDEHEFLHRKGYLDILPRTTHSYTEFYQDRAKTAHGGLPFIELYN